MPEQTPEEKWGVTEVRQINGRIVFIRPCFDAVSETWERVLRNRHPEIDWHEQERPRTERKTSDE
jgi:hypothetical protein